MGTNVVIQDETYNNVEKVTLIDEDDNEVEFYPDAVRYAPQELTEEQKSQARKNIDAVSMDEIENQGSGVNKEQLQQAVDDALRVAKESGEFNGPEGPVGPVGPAGEAGRDGKDGKNGVDGEDGTSPTITVTAIDGGHRITITDVEGTKYIDVMDGTDGADGKDGSDGATGSAGKDGIQGPPGADGEDGVGIETIEQTATSSVDGGANVFTVTLTNGQTATFTVKNGSKGSTGPMGPEGPSGKDGTPCTHSWEGTTLVIESASGKSSANLKGDKGDTGPMGPEGPAGKNGSDANVDELFSNITREDTLVWDGNTEGLECFDMMGDGSYTYYKVTDTVPTIEDLANGLSIVICDIAGNELTELALKNFQNYHNILLHESSSNVIFATKDNVSLYGATIAKKGTYILRSEEFGFVSTLTIPEYEGFNSQLRVINRKHMPEGYAKQEDVDQLSEEIADLNEVIESGELVGKSAYQVARDNGFNGTEKEWLMSLQSANPVVLNKSKYPTEKEAIDYMDGQTDKSVTYIWNNKMYCHTTMEVNALTGACVYGYRNSASSGIKLAEYALLFIIPVSTFTTPITIDYSGYALSESPHIYGGTTFNKFSTTLIANDNWKGHTDPITITDLKGCTYVAFAVAKPSTPSNAEITVNGETMILNVVTDPSQIEGALSSGAVTVNGYADSGVIFTEIVGQTSSCQQYLDARNTYIAPVPSGYCESKVAYNTNGTHYLNKYNFSTMTGMFTALATANVGYVTEKTLGKDASGTYDIKSYVLDAPTTISSGYASAMKKKKPTFIITSGLHGVEPDAVHEVYHFMKDLCENHMENEHLEYLRNNVRFVIVPISNPWGYVNQSYNNSNDVDLNKNFAHGYRTNGTANTGSAAYSEAEAVLLKGVFDEYKDAIFHLECHGKYGEDTSIAQTIWFSLMRSLNSELIEICADTITKQIGRRAYKLGHNANKSVGGYITYYGTNGRPKDYTGTEYGMLSCTMEGTGKLYGTTGYAVDTQKVNTEALENFILRVLDSLNSRVEI